MLFGDAHTAASGQTVWAARSEDGDAGMAWDWVQIRDGVVAIADPMSVVSNVRFLGDDGSVLTATEAALCLNGLVRELPWQLEVSRAIQLRLN